MTAHLPLFDGPAPPPAPPVNRAAVLAALPPAPSQEARVSRARVAPIDHLSACKDVTCQDCDALYHQGFRQCTGCKRWALRSCQYDGLCSSCFTRAGGELDGREVRQEWSPPAGLLGKRQNDPRKGQLS
jgi:hypothetical protein